MTCILELNDAAITLYRDDTVLHCSPGVAVVLDDDVRFGADALQVSRIHPRQTNQQYFTRLNADPLPVPGKRARNHADLAYLHLTTFKPLIDAEGGEVLLAVPGILSPDQLGVLLGVLHEVGIRVGGFVDAAVAALSLVDELPDQARHLDIMMQRAVVTTVDSGRDVTKAGCQEVLDCGLNRLLDAWINVIADRFVRETRFDPLHSAATEQQLFNQLYDWIEHGAQGPDLVVEIVHGDHTRRVELNRGVLEEKSEQRLRQMADALPRGSTAFLSARAARLPGIEGALDALQVRSSTLPGNALTRGCLHNLRHIVPEDGELRLVTRLPHTSGGRETTTPVTPAADHPPAPTHALLGHEAWPLTGGQWTLGGSRRPLSLRHDDGRIVLEAESGVQLNGEPLESPRPLSAGDRVAVGEHEYLMIRVEK